MNSAQQIIPKLSDLNNTLFTSLQFGQDLVGQLGSAPVNVSWWLKGWLMVNLCANRLGHNTQSFGQISV